jgi:hypothetical protein
MRPSWPCVWIVSQDSPTGLLLPPTRGAWRSPDGITWRPSSCRLPIGYGGHRGQRFSGCQVSALGGGSGSAGCLARSGVIECQRRRGVATEESGARPEHEGREGHDMRQIPAPLRASEHRVNQCSRERLAGEVAGGEATSRSQAKTFAGTIAPGIPSVTKVDGASVSAAPETPVAAVVKFDPYNTMARATLRWPQRRAPRCGP